MGMKFLDFSNELYYGINNDFTILLPGVLFAILISCFSFPLLFFLSVREKNVSVDFWFDRTSENIINSVLYLLHEEELFFEQFLYFLGSCN